MTKRYYSSIHQQWKLFARSPVFNSYCPSVKNILMFLNCYFKENSATVRTLLKVPSALKWCINTSYHPMLASSLVTRFLQGLFNLNPLPPRKVRDIWDMNIVLAYWDRTLPNTDLPLMLLTQKTMVLILLSTMCRRQDVLGLTLNFFYEPNAMVFLLDIIPKMYSIFSTSDDVRFLRFHKFSPNIQICPLLAIQHYINRTHMLCPISCNRLFITTQAPYWPAAPMTARRWILSNLSDAGIDICTYSSRSTRHASSSKAFCAGINVDLVMRRAGWINVSSFVLHYNLPIKESKDSNLSSDQAKKSGSLYHKDIGSG